ncbi:hypothetical protein BDV41DRAFT_528604 [Aspergillus transmontanensis]|uniref:Uncharacterized protein n=1 Tax=Aspergillus transmontanensis TaxID=1034304 RepID=A0A5N6W5Z4_9EURO|nr:hypothetical protein BDV41DRAFT_528604 [Aspergillus transmontanensis]
MLSSAELQKESSSPTSLIHANATLSDVPFPRLGLHLVATSISMTVILILHRGFSFRFLWFNLSLVPE